MPDVAQHTALLDDQPLFWRSAGEWGPGDAPPLYLHGVPTNSDDWVAFLEAGGGLAPDLPGFGRSGKRGDIAFTIEGYADFLERFLDRVEVDRVRLCVHDCGSVGLAFAQRHPERVDRLVVMNAVPFLPGYRWHRIARVWRTPVAGELLMGATTRFAFRRLSREANATPGPMPEAFIASIMDHFDEGTQRAILRLYRSAPSDVLAAAGERLGDLKCPALVVWGDKDPYIPQHFADAFAEALGGETKVLHLTDAGHWPWLDQPDVIDTITRFMSP
jgi:pimeloyl-ACP methyl ester carboxylesterase